jgi:hypothetical protein
MTATNQRLAVSRKRTGVKATIGWSLILPLTVFLLTISMAQAQQPKKVPRIGYLSITSPTSPGSSQEAFRQGLRLDTSRGKTL